jgi:uncharacterized membrane-anchored protein YitT (DUF2179 family)
MAVFQKYLSSVAWNLFLITAGAVVFAIGLNGIAVPHKFITGGTTGVSLLIYYYTGLLNPGIWYFVINIPIFVIGWMFVSRRFFLYSIYGTVVFSAAIERISLQIPIHDPLLAVLAAGIILGAGSGITLHSLGSAGGNDIIAIILHQKFNIRMGTFYMAFNLVLFAFSFSVLDTDLVLYSLALSFVISQVLDHVLTFSNQRKMVLIISDKSDEIAKIIIKKLHRGVTFLNGSGAYSGRPKKMILAVVHNYQLKRLEDTVFSQDENAFVIMGNTFNVLGRGFSRRKIY